MPAMLPEVTDGSALDACLEAVAARYGEPHRRYHTAAHLAAVLAEVDRILAEVEVPDVTVVTVAAIFHDAVYDPLSTTNETDSAVLAAEVLGGLMPPPTIAAVQRLVLATRTHQPTAIDEAVLLDADLAVLAGDADAYAAYARGVRAEYAHVDDDAWRVGRARVLRSFLDRDRIFHTAPMEMLEQRARANLRAELAELEAGGIGESE